MTYNGISVITVSSSQMGEFYANLTINSYNLLKNEYVLLDYENELVGPFFWNGERFVEVRFKDVCSKAFGTIKPKDKYQMACLDSFYRNQVTFVSGLPGSGKTQLSLGYLMQELERENINKIYVFTNPVSARGAAKLGYLPGTANDKILGCQVGTMLATKFGDFGEVTRLISQERLFLIPMSNCRGIDIPSGTACYMPEAQNSSIYLMKLFLQRISEGVKTIVEGDIEQTDSDEFDPSIGLNGLQRAMEVFKGKGYAGIVHLPTCYRSQLAADAEEM